MKLEYQKLKSESRLETGSAVAKAYIRITGDDKRTGTHIQKANSVISLPQRVLIGITDVFNSEYGYFVSLARQRTVKVCKHKINNG